MTENHYRMRPSRVLKKLRSGEVATCLKINLADSRVIEIAAMSGFDCLWADMEHVANDWSMIEKQILAAKVYDVDMIVRVSRGSYSEMIKPLELDAAGIMIPHVMSLQDAKRIVRHSKFHPLGLRPLDGGNADALYTHLPLDEYMVQANEQRFNILQIEDSEPLDELEEIISIPGLDMIFFGPGDFSQSIGAPGQMDHPRILETRKRIADLAVKNGKFAGTVGGLGNFEELVQMGYSFVSLGADVVGLQQYCQNIIEKVTGFQGMGKTKSIYDGSTD